MGAATISSLFQVTPRYLRSTNLERDFTDPKALENYVLTLHAQDCLARLAGGLRPASTQRAWRLTGNYGSGKSSFALFLAHWFAGNATQLSKTLQVDVKYDRFSVGIKPRYVPLLVTGSREPMGLAILRGLDRLLSEHYQRGAKSVLQHQIETAVAHNARVSDADVVAFIRLANEKLVKDGKSGGLLILLDELGKFLEYAAYHPESQDVYLLQKLAETAATSGKTAPLFVVGLLHQGFDVYAGNLDQSAQREWEKIAGRFDEIVFNQPLVQISELIASALRVRASAVPPLVRDEARTGFASAVRLGWFGHEVTKSQIADLAVRIYPIHGTVLPALVRAFSRFGQNERSLFSFLLSDEAFGLRSFSERRIAKDSIYRLPDFYDYIRANFGYRLATQSYRSHWTQIESMVESFATSHALELLVVKTIGVLNLLDNPDLLPTEDAIVAALIGAGGYSETAIGDTVKTLHKSRRVLFRRGISGAYCLWPHTSVDLESAYERATKAIGHIESVGPHLQEFLEVRPLVARRHYIQTGNLRYFDVRYARVGEIETTVAAPTHADGVIVVALCETKSECDRAEQLAKSETIKSRPNVLIAAPIEPLTHQAGLVAEALRWDWVAVNTPELNADRFAREEVSRQKAVTKQRLERRVQDLIGLRSLGGAMALNWFCTGRALKIANGRKLLEKLSGLCDDIYHQAPRIKNELVNRHMLSSAAAAARMRLIERLLAGAHKPLLGMDPTKKPPEMSMYLSVLHQARIHVETKNGWALRIPDARHDSLNVAPCLHAIRSFLESSGDQRIKASDILAYLVKPPYGIRAGLAPIYLAVYTALNAQELAFYEDGTFLREVQGAEFLRLCKVPKSFELQLCRVAGLRAEVFESLLRILNIKPSRDREAHILDVVRPLCVFVAGLPDYVRNTRRLPDQALAVREAILAAREPVKVLFHDLPIACGIGPFPAAGKVPTFRAKAFSKQLKIRLDELRTAFDDLLDRTRRSIMEAFNLDGRFGDVRAKLANRADAIVVFASEPRLKALCLRFNDRALAEDAWLESLGSFLVLQPPNRWGDAEEDTFTREISALASRFKNLESIAFEKRRPGDFAEAFKVSLTKNDGTEAQEVVFVEKNKLEDVTAVANEIEQIIGRDRKLGMAALSRVVWSTLNRT